MRFGLLTQWFDPEPGPARLPGVLARGLRDRGHEVQVVTGFPNYPTGRITDGYRMRARADELVDGVRIRRVPLYPSHDSSTLRRSVNFASFGVSASVLGADAFRGLDALWVNFSPITLSWPAWPARRIFGVPVVVHVLDLWPDTVLASGFGSRGRGYTAAQRAMNAWCNRMYRAAQSVAYISPGVGRVLAERGVPEEKLAYVPMWAEESIFRPSEDDLRDELGIDAEAVVVLYAGTLGGAQGLDTLIDACRTVDDRRFVCLIAGSGVQEEELRQRAARGGAGAVRFLGRVPQDRMTALMATADIGYVGLRPHDLSHITMPSKTQAILASGRPLLVAAAGDVASVVRSNALGWAVDPGSPDEIADAIRAACRLGRPGLSGIGARARTYYENTFSVRRGVDRVEELLLAAADARSGQPAAARSVTFSDDPGGHCAPSVENNHEL